IKHPGIVSVLSDGVTEDGCVFLVMELCEGESLDAFWRRSGKKLPENEVLAIADKLLDVVVAAHGHGIVHFDLKPENLFWTRGVVKVLDFGVAQERRTGGTGAIVGTPEFMAPEQANQNFEPPDPRTDLFGVGAILFTLLSGRPIRVFESSSITE